MEMINLRSNLLISRFIGLSHENQILILSWDFYKNKKPTAKIKCLFREGIDDILFDKYKNIKIIRPYLKLC
jgi:hypothetical protein